MSTPAQPAERAGHDGATPDAAPIEIDLEAGRVAITPVQVDGQDRYALTPLPAVPLSQDDVEGLAVALQVVGSRQAVLVDVEDYAGPEDAEDLDGGLGSSAPGVLPGAPIPGRAVPGTSPGARSEESPSPSAPGGPSLA